MRSVQAGGVREVMAALCLKQNHTTTAGPAEIGRGVASLVRDLPGARGAPGFQSACMSLESDSHAPRRTTGVPGLQGCGSPNGTGPQQGRADAGKPCRS